jgi:DNA-binding GntR family transcriptional regulator
LTPAGRGLLLPTAKQSKGGDIMTSKRTNMADQAYGILCDKILRFELAPGTVVSDHTLSQSLEMSRTPIREALVRLQQDGLIEVDGKNKMMVSHVTMKDLEEISQARMAIECKAIDIIHERGGLTREEKAELRDLHEKLMSRIRASELRESYLSDDAFHQAQIRFSGNSRLWYFFILLQKQMLRSRYFITLLVPDWFKITADDHIRLLETLLTDDPEKKKDEINRHLGTFLIQYRQIFDKAPDKSLLSNFQTFFVRAH